MNSKNYQDVNVSDESDFKACKQLTDNETTYVIIDGSLT